jgi:hypothetical protein
MNEARSVPSYGSMTSSPNSATQNTIKTDNPKIYQDKRVAYSGCPSVQLPFAVADDNLPYLRCRCPIPLFSTLSICVRSTRDVFNSSILVSHLLCVPVSHPCTHFNVSPALSSPHIERTPARVQVQDLQVSTKTQPDILMQYRKSPSTLSNAPALPHTLHLYFMFSPPVETAKQTPKRTTRSSKNNI